MNNDRAAQGTLAVRLSLPICALMALFGLLFGLYFLIVFGDALDHAADERLDASLSWMLTETELETSDDSNNWLLEFEFTALPLGFAPYWQVELADSTVLCKSGTERDGYRIQTREVRLGDITAPRLNSAEIQQITAPTSGMGEGIYLYQLPDTSREIVLFLIAGESREVADTPWRRTLYRLLIGGSVTLLLLVLGVRWIIAQKLRPLQRMAEEAASIQPDRPDILLTDPQAGRELATLRNSLNEMIARLAAALSRERHFAGMAAHELRNPLIQLRLGLQVGLRRERSANDYRSIMTEALQDADHLQELVNALLTLARLSGNTAPAITTLALPTLLQEISTKMPAAFRLVNSIPENLLVLAHHDLALLALGNILDNSLRHAPGALPSLEVTEQNSQVIITVTDSGTGIPEAMREQIFAPLYQLDQTRTPDLDSGGHGLGLTIARAAMRAQGGDLICAANNSEKTGAVFQLIFVSGAAEQQIVSDTLF